MQRLGCTEAGVNRGWGAQRLGCTEAGVQRGWCVERLGCTEAGVYSQAGVYRIRMERRSILITSH